MSKSFFPSVDESFLRRRLFSPKPRKIFRDALRKKVLRHAEAPFLLEGISIRPRADLAARLRQKCLLPFSRQKSFLSARFFRIRTRVFRRAAVGLLTAVFFFFGGSPLFFSPPSRATEGTTIAQSTGEVSLFRGGHREIVVDDGISLNAGATIQTDAHSSATIRFFEDSVMRLDENTRVTIETLSPHATRSDLGRVRVVLRAGRIWLKTFSPENDFSEVTVRTDRARITSKNAAAIEIAAGKTGDTFWVHDGSARLFSPTTEYFLPAGKRFLIKGNTEKATLFDAPDAFAADNLARDRAIAETLLREKLAAQKMGFLKKIRDFFSSPSEMEEMFFALVEKAFDGESIDDDFSRFSEKVRAVFRDDPDRARAFLAAAQKNLAGILPDSPLFSLKTAIETLNFDLEHLPKKLAAEEQKTARLWDARRLAAAGKPKIAAEVVRETIENESEEIPINSEILEEKAEQMAAISEIPDEDFSREESKMIAHLAPLLSASRPKNPAATAQNIVRKMKIYTTETGQKNALVAHLSKISDLKTLGELRRRVPEKFRDLVTDRIFSVLEMERRRL